LLYKESGKAPPPLTHTSSEYLNAASGNTGLIQPFVFEPDTDSEEVEE